MRKGHSIGSRKFAIKAVVVTVVILICSLTGFAQGEDGDVIREPKKTTTTKQKPKSPQKPRKPKPAVKKDTKQQPKTTRIAYADLVVITNDGGSEVFISGKNGNVFDGQESAETDEYGNLEVTDLPVGSYTIIIRKEGFFDEERKITLKGGIQNSANFTLRPRGAFLSVSSSVERAAIEIENVGDFEGDIDNLLVSPGTYRVSVYKNGYLPETRTISLSTAGQKEALIFSLKPVSLIELLDYSASRIANGDYSGSTNSARKALAIEPDNIRANLLAGLGYFQGSNPEDGVPFLSRTLGSGATVSLPVRIFNKEGGNLQLVSGSFSFTGNALQLTVPGRPNLNFTIIKNQEIEYFEKIDEFGITHINLKGRGDFNGKSDKRLVRIYPTSANVKASRKELQCSDRCRSEEAAFYELLKRWISGSFGNPRTGLWAVIYPSEDFLSVGAADFSVKFPNNWQLLKNDNNQILVAPAGSFVSSQNVYRYSHGAEFNVWNNPNRLQLSAATDELLRLALARNDFLQKTGTSFSKHREGAVIVNQLQGLSPFTKRSVLLTFYTMMMPNGSVFFAFTAVTPEDQAEHAAIFRRIINSVKFR